MSLKIGRNDPCPCGSGLKHKRCCLGKERPQADLTQNGQQFRFEPGSYGSAEGFIPSVACLKRSGEVENYHYVLVRPDDPCEDEDQASHLAHRDLDAAAAERNRVGTPSAFASSLREAGYVRLHDFQIVDSDQDQIEAPQPAAGTVESLQRVWYQRGFAENLETRPGMHISQFAPGEIPEGISAAIRDNDLLSAGGVYGDPLAGEPVQIDELVLWPGSDELLTRPWCPTISVVSHTDCRQEYLLDQRYQPDPARGPRLPL